MDIEQRLRDSLAVREPGAAFEEAVMARVGLGQPAAAAPPRRRPVWRWTAALAATVFAAAFGLHWHAERERAVHNQQQLMLALAITSHELEQMQQKLTRTEQFGSQENGT
jgi:hypothetical protein